jgi:perosamine synthetase
VAESRRKNGTVTNPLEPHELTPDELDRIRHLLPAPEPPLGSPGVIDGLPAPVGVLRVCEPLLDGNERRYVDAAIDANWISSGGQFVHRFEEAFASAAGCSHGVACSSGTAALHLALAAVGIGAGDDVIIPAFTMIATANAVRLLGATPVLVDSEPRTGNLDVALVEERITSRTRAIVPVHVYGHPIDMSALRALADRHDLLVIEDAAEAHGARYEGRPVGSLGHAAAFSFYANKIVTTGEGGMVTTNDASIAGRVRELCNHAYSPERDFWHRSVAFNYRMSNVQAALGLAQTERLEELVDRRRNNAARYIRSLAGVDGIGLPDEAENVRSVFWMVALTVDAERFGCTRDELRRRLAARGIETRNFFLPVHLQPAYYRQQLPRSYPVAERLGMSGLYVPSSPGLSDADVAYVAAAIVEARG